jgi:hypothetical protein
MRPGIIVQIEQAYPALLETDTNGGYAIGAWRTPARVADTVCCRQGRVLRSVCVVASLDHRQLAGSDRLLDIAGAKAGDSVACKALPNLAREMALALSQPARARLCFK